MAKKNVLPRGKVTVDTLLSLDDVHSTLKDLVEQEANIDELVCIYTLKDDDGFIHRVNSGMRISRIVHLLECIKHGLLHDGEKP